MKPLDIEFAGRAKSASWRSLAALALGGSALAASFCHYSVLHGEVLRAQTEVREASTRVRELSGASSAGAAPVAADKIRALNTAIGQLNLPWAELFHAFEVAKPDNVALISFEPNGKNRTIVVQAESRTPEHMIEFVGRLKAVAIFEDALLTKHEVRTQDANLPFRFVVELRWKSDV